MPQGVAATPVDLGEGGVRWGVDGILTAALRSKARLNARGEACIYPRVVVTVVGRRPADEPVTPYLVVTGTAHLDQRAAPELLTELTAVRAREFVGKFPPAGSPLGVLTRVRIEKVGGVGPWAPFGGEADTL